MTSSLCFAKMTYATLYCKGSQEPLLLSVHKYDFRLILLNIWQNGDFMLLFSIKKCIFVL